MHNKCNMFESSQNHPLPWPMEKLSSIKMVPHKRMGTATLDNCKRLLKSVQQSPNVILREKNSGILKA